ncbi:MAG: cytochrome biosis protein [Proteobacteria bacterium]|nr:cytochrome biosis protein [Pseudomonadota bacterium]
MQFKDYYEVLGVGRDAKAEDIKRAYRRLARKYHPDVSKEPNAEERFKEVQEAYEVLKDPEKRAAYDQLGRDYRPGQDFRPPPDWGQGFEFSGPGGAGGFSDFFEQLFGQGSPFGGRGPGRQFDVRGEDHHAQIDLSLEQAYAGGTHTIGLQHPETGRDGRVELRSRQLKVRIPAGVTDGQVIRLAGQGAPGVGRGGRGDLYLKVALRPHPLFVVDRRDVTLTLPVAPWEAALGGVVPVPTPGGTVELRLPPNSRAGQKLRLKGRGLPGTPPGDQYVVLQVVLPPAETPAARELFERMRRELPFDPRANLGGAHATHKA